MRAIITIDMDNAAFTDCPGPELARILKGLAAYVRMNCKPGMVEPARDVNGNQVGQLEITEEQNGTRRC